MTIPILDTHQHLLFPKRFGYAWCKGIPALEGRTFDLDEYRRAAAGTGIDRTLFMEVDVDEPDIQSETRWALDLAADPASRIAGVIAACRPESPDFPKQLESTVHPKLRGFRRVLHTQLDEVSQQPLFVENLARLEEFDLTFDLCLHTRQLPLAKPLLRTLPDVRFVLDHCGIPQVRERKQEPWRTHIRDLSRFPNLACKVSGLVAYADRAEISAQTLRPYVEHCIESFGWDRVLFGGDWPVCTLTSSLKRWVDIARELVKDEPVERQEKLFYRNAERVYRCAAS
jgi:predicted TIM-barrel fold metal-dependent hydrolase